MKRIIVSIMLLAMLAPFDVIAQTYNLTPSNATIQFKVRNMAIMNVKGAFEKFKGTVDIDETDITKSKVDANIETASINTGINKRDNHLRSPDFLDVAKFPTMKFVSTNVEKVGADILKLTGNLTIKGVTKPVVLLVEGPTIDAKGSLKDLVRAASATATINRQDFGVSWGAVIGDEVFITISTQLNKQ
jgi:polyisoprenoid-binding protein YceI